MYIAVIIVACILILIILLRVIFLISPCISFFVKGSNAGFGFGELRFLWPIADDGNPDSPAALFESVALLDKSIAAVLKKAEKDKTPLPQGKPVPLEFLSMPPVAKKGRTVLIVVRQGGLMAAVKGILLEDGAAGDIVRVRRADDKKVILRARVLDSETVEVDVP